jgi:hypothetical protein
MTLFLNTNYFTIYLGRLLRSQNVVCVDLQTSNGCRNTQTDAVDLRRMPISAEYLRWMRKRVVSDSPRDDDLRIILYDKALSVNWCFNTMTDVEQFVFLLSSLGLIR